MSSFLTFRRPPTSTLFPYTTLFRSGSAGTPPPGTQRSAIGDRLYRVVWRWHFYAGMIITLPLIVVAATGGLYIFKDRSEEHTSELQSRRDLVCRLLLEKKKKK